MRTKITRVAVVVALIAAGFAINAAQASDPSSGQLSSSNREVTWTGNPQPATAVDEQVSGEVCEPGRCDEYVLDVDTTGFVNPVIDIVVSTLNPAADYDLYVYDSGNKQVADSAATGTPPEAVTITNPTAGPYRVVVNPWVTTPADSYEAKATLREGPAPAGDDSPTQTWFFTSAAGGYDLDLAGDPAATVEGRAPAGSALTTTRPSGDTTASAPGAQSTQGPGEPNAPTFSLPSGVVVSSVCLDLWVSSSAPVINIGAFTRFHDADGTAHPNADATHDPSTSPVRMRAEVAAESVRLSVGADGSFVFGSFDGAPSTLHYGSASMPSSITINPVPGTCLAPSGAVATPSTTASPVYTSYVSPDGMADDAGEPTVGVNWNTGAALFQASLETDVVTFDDATNPPTATWEDRSVPGAVTSLDPIIEVEPHTGRAFASQLLGVCSFGATTSDDGQTWDQSTGCPQPHGVDHQSIGSGPYSPQRPRIPEIDSFEKVFYYCSQSVAAAFCGRSTDGGRTFQNTVPIYTIDQCRGLHGHVKVAPDDGTIYVPNSSCNGKAGVSVSEDGGVTYTVRTVDPGGDASSESDAAVSIADDGTVYLHWISATGQPMVASSTDHGRSWSTPVDVGGGVGVENAMFPVTTAGDGARAAVTFLGTALDGDFTDTDWGLDRSDTSRYLPDAAWYLYVAHTYDGGATWTTSRVTDAPVQRGCLTTGTGSPCRNLLDFNGISKDAMGRVLIAWADGCTGGCETSLAVADNGRTSDGVLSRLTTGFGLFAAYDGQLAPGDGTPVDACAGVNEITDPAGDATVLTGLGLPEVPASTDDVDIVRVSAAPAGDAARFAVEVVDLGPTPVGDGDAVRSFFNANGIDYTLDMHRTLDGTTSGALSKPDPAGPTGTESITVAEGFPVVFDADTEVASADIPFSALGITTGDKLSNVRVLWRRSLEALALPADEASGTCPLYVGSKPLPTTTTTTVKHGKGGGKGGGGKPPKNK